MMDQKRIDKITSDVLKINNNPEFVHEFMCALENAKAMVENKLNRTMYKASQEACLKSFAMTIAKGLK